MPDALETLRHVNSSLRAALFRLRPEITHCSTIKPQDFSNLHREILRASECLSKQAPASEVTAAMEAAAVEYLTNLERLHTLLPDLHGRLLAERSRLEEALKQVAATAAWAGANKSTL
jgi:hypothetical protein